jgi:hypothetical protein
MSKLLVQAFEDLAWARHVLREWEAETLKPWATGYEDEQVREAKSAVAAAERLVKRAKGLSNV